MFAIPQVIGPDLAQRLSATHRRASTAYLAAARLALEELLRQPDAVAALPLTRKRHGYARTLLFGDGKLSLWAMSWDVGAKTPIHDHHCSCCFGLLSGILKEIEFRTVDDATAVVTAQTVRHSGNIVCMVPTGPNVHQVVNEGPTEAISLHLYGYDHTAHATSIHREYRLARH
jgi:predicted metal-dependent enzyme (double-stranded beta helix superfamily)